MASDFFMIFWLIILAGRNAATGKSGLESTPLVQGRKRSLNLSKGRILRRNTVAVGKEFLASQKGNLAKKNARSGVKEFAIGM